MDGYSISHRARVKAVAGGFARWLIEEKELLRRNPARGVEIPAQAALAPRRLDDDQRYVLRELVERADDPRGTALFALGYWAGCRVSDVSWLRMEHTHIGPKTGWLHVGYKGGKARDIDLLNVAYYLGHVTKKGTPAIQTTVRYTQVSREQVKAKLRDIKG